MHNFVLSPIDPEKLISCISERVTANILKAVRNEQQPTEHPDQLLTIYQAAEFLNLTVPTMYSKVSKGELPVMKRSKRLYKGSNHKSQLKTIFHYLSEHVATASMVSEATGIPQKNICRYKRDLEKAGMLWEIEKKYCKKTGFRAWYLTTDPAKALKCSLQLNLF